MAALENQQWGINMGQSLSQSEKAYFKALGARIAQCRNERGLTQQQVADALNMKQQAYAHYEVGRYRMPVSLLPALCEVLAVDVQVLLGMAPKNGKRGPAPRFQQQIEQIGKLPKVQQKIVVKMLDGLLAEHSR